MGPLVEIYSNEITLLTLSITKLAVSPEELLRANKLSSLGVTLALMGFWFHLRWRDRTWASTVSQFRPVISPERVALAFVLGGGLLKYLLLKPAQWGMIDIVIPGSVTNVGYLLELGFAILAFLAMKKNRRAGVLFLILWPPSLFLTILSFSKTEMVVAMLLPLIGAYLADRKLLRLIAGLSVVAFVFIVAQPWVHYGRAIVYARTGNINEAGYTERIEILGTYVRGDGVFGPIGTDQDQVQTWWERLSYAGPQALAMEFHDQGFANRSLSTFWMSFFPRAIWWDKPIMIGPGLAFYRLVTGNENGQSYLGLSIYGDLYWQYGWAGILVGCPLIGWLFAILAARSIHAVRSREFIMLPAVLLALQMVLLGPTAYVINGIIAPLPIYIAYLHQQLSSCYGLSLGGPTKQDQIGLGGGDLCQAARIEGIQYRTRCRSRPQDRRCRAREQALMCNVFLAAYRAGGDGA